MQQTKEFKPVFLYRDDEAIKKIENEYSEWTIYTQNGINEAKKLFDEELTDEELTQIMKGGWKAAAELIKSKSDFPKARVETLLDLQGKTPDTAINALLTISNRSAAIKASIVDGEVVIGENVKEELKEKYSFYTKTAYQNEVLANANELCESIVKLIAKNLIGNNDLHEACRGLRIVKPVMGENGKYKVIPNYRRILEQ